MYGADWAQAYAGELFIAERLAPLPRASVVYAAETIADEAQATQRLLDEAFDLRQAAITDRPTGLPAQAGRPARRATLEVYGDTRVVVRAFADEAGLLVLGDAYHPGWIATIDGQPAPVQRVNLLWRGVPVPAGEHEVVFTLAPPSLRFGLAPGRAGGRRRTGVATPAAAPPRWAAAAAGAWDRARPGRRRPRSRLAPGRTPPAQAASGSSSRTSAG